MALDPRPARERVSSSSSGEGDEARVDGIVELVYDDLRRIATGLLRAERAGHTLSATAIVHEAYVKLARSGRVDWKDRAHFLGVAARVMRHVLVDHAKARRATKRGGDAVRVTLTADMLVDDPGDGVLDVLTLDQSLATLADRHPRMARVAEMRIFGGMESSEIAAVEKCTDRTIRSDWSFARLWLARELDLARE